MREEIESGLKNALERGYSLDEAVASFINAGYNPVEVKEAANNLGSTVGSIVSQDQGRSQPAPSAFQSIEKSATPNTSVFTVTNSLQPVKKKSSKKIWLIILIIFLVILLIGLGGLIFFSKEILNFLKP